MNEFDTLIQYLPLLAPILLIQLGLMAAALWDLSRRSAVRGPKWLWIVVIVFVNMVGPIAYFLVGREDE